MSMRRRGLLEAQWMTRLQEIADVAMAAGMDPAAPPPEININEVTNELEPDIPADLRPLWDAATQAASEMGPSSPYAQALRLVRLRRQGLIAALRLLGAIRAPGGGSGPVTARVRPVFVTKTKQKASRAVGLPTKESTDMRPADISASRNTKSDLARAQLGNQRDGYRRDTIIRLDA